MRILWVPHTGWHIPQRAHLFARALAARHEVHVTDWVADFATLRDYASLRYLRNFSVRQYRDGNILVHGIPRISPALPSRALRRWNVRLFARAVARIIARYQIDVVVGSFVVPPPRAPRVIFDLADDNVAYWRSFGRVPAYAGEIARTEQAYLRAADAVVAVSSVLAGQAQAAGARGPVYLIPNAVNLAHFPQPDRAALRARLGVSGRLVGSVGSHDKPAELDKMLAAARLLAGEDLTFLIAGRGAAIAGGRAHAAQAGLTNIRFTGYIPPAAAQEWMSVLDVGLCPYPKSAGADASSPMRLLQYSAAGVPVVCTDLEEVRRMGLPNVVLVADGAAALAAGIRVALHMPHARPREIAAYDLERLVARYETVLCGCAPPGAEF